MNETTFYLKYRPGEISELDSLSVKEALSKIIASGRIPHALLFAGPKGTGKTSAARILAKAVNCEKPGKDRQPCGKCKQCLSIARGNNLDVVEMDAASHGLIDDIRDLRDAVKLAPAKAKKKIYIIDEAHMLTPGASNALLKTLEEPPSHVVFILATTNPEKLIETIRSRCTRITFNKATTEEIVSSLGRIVKGEKIKIEKEALKIIAENAQGSFRDAAKILEQLISEEKSLKVEDIKEAILKTKDSQIGDLLETIMEKDAKKGLELIEKLIDKGVIMENLVTDLLSEFKKSLLSKMGIGDDPLKGFSKTDIIWLIKIFGSTLVSLKTTVIEQLPIELAIVEWCEKDNKENKEESVIKEETVIVSGSSGKPNEPQAAPIGKSILPKEMPMEQTKVEEIVKSLDQITDEIWKTILAKMRPVNTSIEALLRATRPLGLEGNTLRLGVFYRFHKERLEDTKNKRIFEDVVATVLGKPIKLVCCLTEPPQKKIETTVQVDSVLTEGKDKDIIKVAEEIFGN